MKKKVGKVFENVKFGKFVLAQLVYYVLRHLMFCTLPLYLARRSETPDTTQPMYECAGGPQVRLFMQSIVYSRVDCLTRRRYW